jgi:hypothetical protein
MLGSAWSRARAGTFSFIGSKSSPELLQSDPRPRIPSFLPAVSDCRALLACQFTQGNIGEPHWVLLSKIDVSEDDQRQRLARIRCR